MIQAGQVFAAAPADIDQVFQPVSQADHLHAVLRQVVDLILKGVVILCGSHQCAQRAVFIAVNAVIANSAAAA